MKHKLFTGSSCRHLSCDSLSFGVRNRPRPLGVSTGGNLPRPRPLGVSTWGNLPRPRPLGVSTGGNLPRPRPLGVSTGGNLPRPRPLGVSTWEIVHVHWACPHGKSSTSTGRVHMGNRPRPLGVSIWEIVHFHVHRGTSRQHTGSWTTHIVTGATSMSKARPLLLPL